MKRDVELMRAILFKVEEHDSYSDFFEVSVDGYSDKQVWYHTMQLHKEGLIEAVKVPMSFDDTDEEWYPKTLTPAGHEFLDAARSGTIWEKAKNMAVQNTGVLTLEALKITLSTVIQNALKGG